MEKSMTVLVGTSDKSNIRLTISLNPKSKFVEEAGLKVREAVSVALFSEIWKKAAIHGWRNHCYIEIPVKYDDLQIDYNFAIFVESAMTVKADVSRETRNILPKIERIIAYKIREIEKLNN